ncbi:MAG: serine hydroxymethyltransferase [Cohaesibacteraceae bacterium]
MGEIYLEIVPVDKALRITAVDPGTGLEVVFTAPASASRERIDRVATAKLKARIERERQSSAGAPRVAARRERGKLV